MRASQRGMREIPFSKSFSVVVTSRKSLPLMPQMGRFCFFLVTKPTLMTLKIFSRWSDLRRQSQSPRTCMTNSLLDLWRLFVSPASFSILMMRFTFLSLKLYMLSQVIIRARSCTQLYLLNFYTLQLIMTTSYSDNEMMVTNRKIKNGISRGLQNSSCTRGLSQPGADQSPLPKGCPMLSHHCPFVWKPRLPLPPKLV
ncbi:hypothetical protein FGO68_gene2942 [Halteria grandinella]|uniref:Uncharacterized protein n=1 Tax=Halteria grandinella TaxID=5974 RepID=A0A8J8NVJ3_HALGN|nr:hypothetical protein FGO68_gene2942 [Halteria grandinella]